MRSRRIAVRRDQGKRRLKRVAIALGAVAVLVVAAAATQTELLDVDRVRIDGGAHTSAADVGRVARIGVGDAMIAVDADRVAGRIEDLPGWRRRRSPGAGRGRSRSM